MSVHGSAREEKLNLCGERACNVRTFLGLSVSLVPDFRFLGLLFIVERH